MLLLKQLPLALLILICIGFLPLALFIELVENQHKYLYTLGYQMQWQDLPSFSTYMLQRW
jgi:hypothetical protein